MEPSREVSTADDADKSAGVTRKEQVHPTITIRTTMEHIEAQYGARSHLLQLASHVWRMIDKNKLPSSTSRVLMNADAPPIHCLTLLLSSPRSNDGRTSTTGWSQGGFFAPGNEDAWS